MHDHSISSRLDEATLTQIAWGGTEAETTSLEENASSGCSVCARALVNVREMAAELACSEAPPAPLESRELRKRALLERTRSTLSRRKAGAAERKTGASEADLTSTRVLDASATVARKHITLPGEEARIREIDALRATEMRPGEGTERALSQLAGFLDFTILFVSIVRGERVSYRAQRGLPEGLRAFRELRREMSHCTHCVSGNAPLLIENARLEPFFRGNKATTRFGVAAYAGVPLRSTSGITLGTLCALDFAPRAIPQGSVRVLEIFARRAIAEIEGERAPGLLREIVEVGSEQGDVYRPNVFVDLANADLQRPASRGKSALLLARAGDPRAVLSLIGPHETAGRIDGSTFGILLPCAGESAAAARFERLRADAGASALGLALAMEGTHTAAEWIAQALR